MWLKICGLISADGARSLAGLEIDAFGLNRYKPSPRYLTRKRAAELSRQINRIDSSKMVVGVYVNAAVEVINKDIEEIGLDAVQLHGDEPADFLNKIKPTVKIIKAFRVGKDFNIEKLNDYNCWAYLLDASVDGKYGGTGHLAPWNKIAGWTDRHRIILAGGLKPANIKEALQIASPWGIDLCSGVESEDGQKDIEAVMSVINQTKEQTGVKN